MTTAPPVSLFDEIVEFLTSEPTLAQLAEYMAPDHLNERLHYLLDRNSHDQLTTEERAELDEFLRINHLLTMLKARARLKLAGKV